MKTHSADLLKTSFFWYCLTDLCCFRSTETVAYKISQRFPLWKFLRWARKTWNYISPPSRFRFGYHFENKSAPNPHRLCKIMLKKKKVWHKCAFRLSRHRSPRVWQKYRNTAVWNSKFPLHLNASIWVNKRICPHFINPSHKCFTFILKSNPNKHY